MLRLSYFDPEELLDVADDLIVDPKESKIRTVMNRSYYSCFLTVKKSKKHFEAEDDFTHTDAYKAVLGIKEPYRSAAKSLYTSLQVFRAAADYGLSTYQQGKILKGSDKIFTVNLDEKNGKKAIKKAREFLDQFSKTKA